MSPRMMRMEVRKGGQELIIRIPFQVIAEFIPAAKAGGLRVDMLSPRERGILSGILAGKQNKEIGHELSISERTVKFHVTSNIPKDGHSRPRRSVARNGQGALNKPYGNR
jgi:DNA-binding NarL/FixJ family response regulator